MDAYTRRPFSAQCVGVNQIKLQAFVHTAITQSQERELIGNGLICLLHLILYFPCCYDVRGTSSSYT